jgi:AcrR family transcriptional regulator
VLAGARATFAEHGYAGASIREIAGRAGVDPALVLQFFGSKDELFAAAMELPFDSSEAVEAIVSGPRAGIGRRIVMTFLRLWDDPAIGPQMVALVRSATTNEAAARRLRELVDGQLLGPVAEALGVPDGRLRAQAAGSHLVGLGFGRYIVRLEPLASASAEEIARLVAPAVQRYLTLPASGGSGRS